MFIDKQGCLLLVLAGLGCGVTAHAQDTLVLTDNSPSANNGDLHISDLILAFTNAGASITTDTAELTNGLAMNPALLAGRDLVLVITVSGLPIDDADIPVLQQAVNTRSACTFMFFSDTCSLCTLDSTAKLLSMVNSVEGWSATQGGPSIDQPYSVALNTSGPYNAAFSALPQLTSTAYSPWLGMPAANVIYFEGATPQVSSMAVMAPGAGLAATVFLASDTTQFLTSGAHGGVPGQGDSLAAAYLDAAAPYACQFPATAVPRDCTPPNVDVLTATPAIIGAPWSAEVTHAAGPATASALMIRSSVLAGVPTPRGCILVRGTGLASLTGAPDTQPPILATQMNWSFAIPNNASLIGLAWHAQALTFGSAAKLSNAIDGIVGTY